MMKNGIIKRTGLIRISCPICRKRLMDSREGVVTYADVFNRMNFDATEKFDELMGALDVDEDDEE